MLFIFEKKSLKRWVKRAHSGDPSEPEEIPLEGLPEKSSGVWRTCICKKPVGFCFSDCPSLYVGYPAEGSFSLFLFTGYNMQILVNWGI